MTQPPDLGRVPPPPPAPPLPPARCGTSGQMHVVLLEGLALNASVWDDLRVLDAPGALAANRTPLKGA